jgi:hypothetical protein
MKKISDEYFVLNRETGYVHTFNESGAFLWEKIATNIPYDAIINELLSAYDCTHETARQDLFEFFSGLEEKKLITIVTEHD